MREDTQDKRIDSTAPASKRLGDEKHPHHLNLAGLEQLDGLDEDATPASGDWLLLEDATTGILKKATADNVHTIPHEESITLLAEGILVTF